MTFDKPLQLVDFHCHLDLYQNFDLVLRDCELAAVNALTVTTTPKAWPRNIELLGDHESIRVALGLHPQLVAERSHELSLFEKHLGDTRYIGEVGLDAGPQHFRSMDVQKKIFTRVLEACAEHGNKILSVHSVRAASTVLDLIEKHLPSDRGKVVLHWFSGSKAELKRAIDLGAYFSVNRQMLQQESRLAVVKSIPPDKLLTETDGPFVRVNDEPVQPSSVLGTVEVLAGLYGKGISEISTMLLSNLRALESI